MVNEFRDPYSSQNRRAQQIAERKSATHTPETLPEHLRPAMELAEEHFLKTAPSPPGPSAEINPGSQDTKEFDPRPVEHRPWRENLPTEQHREAALGGLAAARAALEEARRK